MKGAVYFAPEGTDPNDPKAWQEISCAEVTGYSIGPVDVDEVQASRRLGDNFTADLTFKRVIYAGGRGYGKSQRMRERAKEYEESRNSRVADWVDHNLGIQLAPWQRSFMNGLLGSWRETPREELQRRLNDWLRGTYPGEPINWKGLK